MFNLILTHICKADLDRGYLIHVTLCLAYTCHVVLSFEALVGRLLAALDWYMTTMDCPDIRPRHGPSTQTFWCTCDPPCSVKNIEMSTCTYFVFDKYLPKSGWLVNFFCFACDLSKSSILSNYLPCLNSQSNSTNFFITCLASTHVLANGLY